jgi:hypothetical protein
MNTIYREILLDDLVKEVVKYGKEFDLSITKEQEVIIKLTAKYLEKIEFIEIKEVRDE